MCLHARGGAYLSPVVDGHRCRLALINDIALVGKRKTGGLFSYACPEPVLAKHIDHHRPKTNLRFLERKTLTGNNMSMFKWTMEARVNASYTIRLNSTVFYTLNTSGVAPQTWV